jgi:C_GCAxxG_C_C family probable redox protein
VDLYRKEPYPDVTKFATGFGGGIGGSHCETCGALTGGMITLGWMFGRKGPGDDKQKVYSLSVEFRNQFLKNFGSTNCQIILDMMEKQDISMDCKKLTAEAAGVLYDILQKEHGSDS